MRYSFFLNLLLILSLAGSPAGAQQSADEAGAGQAVETEAAAEPPDDDEADTEDAEADDEPAIDLDDPEFADLDRQTYEEDDDDFVPTEEVPADQAIPFPSDI